MKRQEFEIKGECVPKGRPRLGKYGNTFTPSKTRNYERHVYYSLKQQGAKQVTGGVRVEMTVVKQPPRSWSNKRRRSALNKRVLATARPDLDNYLKSILDGAGKLIFKDDSFVVEVNMRKEYGKEDTVFLTVEELEGEPAYG